MNTLADEMKNETKIEVLLGPRPLYLADYAKNDEKVRILRVWARVRARFSQNFHFIG